MRFVLGMAVRETRASWARLVFFFLCIVLIIFIFVMSLELIRFIFFKLFFCVLAIQ